MLTNTIYAIGVMSGTSLDGLDLVYVQFDSTNEAKFKILNGETIPYTKEWKLKLQEAIHYSSQEIKALDIEYGLYLGSQINSFLRTHGLTTVHFIASHGHTVLHQPEKGITLQVGCGKQIAKQTGILTVYDFRSQDVALGGQGAPLVPMGDQRLFSSASHCLNLGGFSNVSYPKNGRRLAFDICPVNIVLNHYAEKLGYAYDKNGEIARSGSFDTSLFTALNHLDYYHRTPPKSLGLEWVQQYVFPLLNSKEIPVENILHTFTKHAAYQIGKVLKNSTSTLVTGGGFWNTFLMECIQNTGDFKIKNTDALLVDYKEALVFALLGLLRLKNENNCLQSVTGAIKNHSSGKIVSV